MSYQVIISKEQYDEMKALSDMNESVVSRQQLSVFEQATEAAVNMAKKDYQERVEELERELDYIRSRWWYKLFFSFDKYYDWSIKKPNKNIYKP